MHFHLVNVQLINRQAFDPASLPYIPSGSVIPPADERVGWKETVPMYPGTVTRVIMKLDLSAKIVDKNLKPINTIGSATSGQLPIATDSLP